MGKRDKALRNTAFHEAGHAVMAFELSVPFLVVTIEPTKLENDVGTLGHVAFRNPPEWAIPHSSKYAEGRARRWLEKQACISFAGRIAEAMHAGRRPFRRYSSGDDWNLSDYALEACGGFEEEASAWCN